jgi:putative transcriptional regulator
MFMHILKYVTDANTSLQRRRIHMRLDRVKLITELARRDMTVNCLAQAAGVTRVTISGIKCGKSCADSTAYKIAQALNVPIDFLIEKAGEASGS